MRMPRWEPSLPPSRAICVFAFDPSVATRLDTLSIQQTTLNVPWEDDLEPGPRGDYIEVIDYDPSDRCFYPPVNLNDPRIVARDGPPPSIGSPQFHQTMAYGVAMKVIDTFERALGRRVLWSPRPYADERGKNRNWEDQFVRRLRIYPHALREPNAYYSPEKKALLFGCFADTEGRAGVPGGAIFTCLSHDVVAHEVTHAVMDGEHPNYLFPDNPDVHAFHEAFADIVALFQHFTIPEALAHQLSRTRGNLREQNLLGELAQEFGAATGNRGSLRSAIGRINPDTGIWERQRPDPTLLSKLDECHDRGSILVAAVFEAFLLIYDRRRDRLVRIASGGSGLLNDGHLPTPLLEALADEAAKTAGHVLKICIRALDYCPPVDLTFGEFLRALLTADSEAVRNDELAYRHAFVEAFRSWGIVPPGVRSLSIESVLWETPMYDKYEWMKDGFLRLSELKRVRSQAKDSGQKKAKYEDESLYRDLASGIDRKSIFLRKMYHQMLLHDDWLAQLRKHSVEAIHDGLGVYLHAGAPKSIRHSRTQPSLPAIQISGVRPTRRADDRGETRVDLVVELRQERRVAVIEAEQAKLDETGAPAPGGECVLRGGATLLIDAETGRCRYAIHKHIDSRSRMNQLRRLHARFGRRFGIKAPDDREPFAMLHRG